MFPTSAIGWVTIIVGLIQKRKGMSKASNVPPYPTLEDFRVILNDHLSKRNDCIENLILLADIHLENNSFQQTNEAIQKTSQLIAKREKDNFATFKR